MAIMPFAGTTPEKTRSFLPSFFAGMTKPMCFHGSAVSPIVSLADTGEV